MKRMFASRVVVMLIAALLLAGMAAAAEGYRPAAGNEKPLAKLLTDLVNAYEKPSAEDDAQINADLEAVRMVSGTDYEIASAIADHWRAVFLDEGYTLNLYMGDQRADGLELSGLRDGDIDAINAYRGEYMSAYSWASLTESSLIRRAGR